MNQSGMTEYSPIDLLAGCLDEVRFQTVTQPEFVQLNPVLRKVLTTNNFNS